MNHLLRAVVCVTIIFYFYNLRSVSQYLISEDNAIKAKSHKDDANQFEFYLILDKDLITNKETFTASSFNWID